MDGIFLTTELQPTGGRTAVTFRISFILRPVQSILFIRPIRPSIQVFI
jgi:hypothetical protein